MPIIRVSLVEGFATMAKKAEITARMTDALAAAMGEVTRPMTYVVVDDIKPGAVSFAGVLITEETMRAGLVGSEQELAVRLTPEHVEHAYASLADDDEAEQYWSRDVYWSVPGDHPLSGVHQGRDALLKYLRTRDELTGGSYRAERERVLVDGSTSIDVARTSAVRADGSERALAADVVQVLTWKDGKVVAGREAQLGAGAAAVDAFWS